MVSLVGERFFELSLELFMIADFNGKILKVNPAWQSLLGYSLDELVGRPYTDFVHPDDVLTTNGETQSLSEGKDTFGFENRYITKAGEVRWLKWKAKVVPGEAVYAVARDVTIERRTIQELINEKNQSELASNRLSAFFMQVPALVMVTHGPNHVLELANKQYMELADDENVVGKSIREVFPSLDVREFEIIDKVYRTGERFLAKNHPIKAVWPGKEKVSIRYFTLIYEPKLNSAGDPDGIICFATDETEAIGSAERLRKSEKMAALGQLSAAIAHEINNPLAYSMLNVELAQSESQAFDSVDLNDQLNNIYDGLTRVKTIVQNLKSFSYSRDTKRVPVSLAQVVKSALNFAGNELRHRTRIEANLNECTDVVLADSTQLTQVFVNLLVNAAHSIEAGKVDDNLVKIEIRRDGPQVKVDVCDTGTGISKQNLDRIFEPFYTSKAANVGTGLGLSICQEIVASMNGTIEVESQVGKGSRFTVCLPTTDARIHDITPAAQSSASVYLNAQTKKKLLILDDDARLSHVIASSLASDFEITVLNHATAALKAVVETEFDIILSDVMMPDINGKDLYYLIQQAKPGLERKIVFMSGGAFFPSIAEWLQNVENKCVTKPFTAADLKAVLATINTSSAHSAISQ